LTPSNHAQSPNPPYHPITKMQKAASAIAPLPRIPPEEEHIQHAYNTQAIRMQPRVSTYLGKKPARGRSRYRHRAGIALSRWWPATTRYWARRADRTRAAGARNVGEVCGGWGSLMASKPIAV
jgi:hypothetical protein